jgi:hypothetical protein
MTQTDQGVLTNDTWQVFQNRYVGYIDIMGFKDLVARKSSDYIYKMMHEIIKATGFAEKIATYLPRKEKDLIKIMTYSDSIMVYSKDDSPASLECFIDAVSSLSYDLFESGIPHKGAVAFGSMTLDFKNNIFFGQALIDAYLLQEELNYYGVVVHSTAEYRRGFKTNEAVLLHNCPFKNRFGSHYTVTPAIFIENLDNHNSYNNFIKKVIRLRINTSGSLRKYIDNTVKYFKETRTELMEKLNYEE